MSGSAAAAIAKRILPLFDRVLVQVPIASGPSVGTGIALEVLLYCSSGTGTACLYVFKPV